MSLAAHSQLDVPSHPLIDVTPRRSDFKLVLTQHLGVLFEQPLVRFGAVGALLLGSTMLAQLPSRMGLDYGWLYILPVAISAISAGLTEGLIVAFAAAALCGLQASHGQGFDPTTVAGVICTRFALYGITAGLLGAFAEAHHMVQTNLRRLATTDPLTQVANVSSFYSFMSSLEREPSPFALVVVDLDDLKKLNDTYGHQAGSAAIQAVARVLRSVVRVSDLVARFGGDEFVVVLKEVDAVGAQIVINRVRAMLAAEFIPGVPRVSVTISAGAALYGRDGNGVEELLAAADAAMYADKRNRKTDPR